MARNVLLAAVAATLVGTVAMPLTASAGARKEPVKVYVDQGLEHPASGYYRRKGPQVRGFLARRGGYSYSSADTINTYGDARTRYGANSSYRDQMIDRQTTSGPFDHGFFFDSGIAPRGGNSPYPN